MKFGRERKSRYMIHFFARFFHVTVLEVEKSLADFFKFQSFCTLTTTATHGNNQFQCSYIVFGNKPKPLFVGVH